MNPRILIVDDTQAIHDAIRGVLTPDSNDADLDNLEAALFGIDAEPDGHAHAAVFEVDSAHQGAEALARVERAVDTGAPYAVAFVDMRMPPGWDGLRTIEALWKVDPALQVVICTAYSDRSWDEIRERLGHNDGLLILKKPFDPIEVVQLAHTLSQKWQANREVRSLLRSTLGGAVGVMSEMLGLVMPTASDRVERLRHGVRHLQHRLDLRHWAYDLAAGLSQVGCVTLPGATLERWLAGQTLAPSEKTAFDQHPRLGAQLVRRIPRLHVVADIVAVQHAPPPWPVSLPEADHVVAIGANLLCCCLTVDRHLSRGSTLAEACNLAVEQGCPRAVVHALRDWEPPGVVRTLVRAAGVHDLRVGMILDEHVMSSSGTVVCPKGMRVTHTMAARLRTFAKRVGVREPFRVRVPCGVEELA